MSVIPNITLGMDGKSQTNTLGMMPPTGFPYDAIGNRTPLMYGPYTKAPNMLSAAIDYSTRRGVLPCKGITHRVLRRPAMPSAGGMVAPTGIGRHQPRGLAYSPDKPLDVPIMPQSNPFSSGLNNPLKQPA